ncbi:M13-type metalloendopeptidase [Holzapfeliella sp. He02]|uniref:M13-type metalloendopeptidase n=1 Tax=Holzapfeliella saturejae TaxID=3082953 RepID=A0ABU8SF34_9LACO
MTHYMNIRGGAGDITVPETKLPKDNLYLAVNAEWLKTAEIPGDKPATGSFNKIAENVEKTLMADFEDFASGKKEPQTKELKEAVKLYQLALDFDKRNADGAEPIQEDLAKLTNLKDFAEFNQQAGQLSKTGFALPIDFGVNIDMKDTKHHILFHSGPGVFLPDTTQYGTEQGDQLLAVYKDQSEKLLQLAGLDDPTAKGYVKDALAFDEKLSKVVKSNEEWADRPAVYNPYSAADFKKHFKSFDVEGLITELVGHMPERLIEAEPRFLEHAESLVNADNFNEIKGWMIVSYINSVVGSLSQEFRETGFAYNQALTGVKEMAKPKKHAYHLANSRFAEPVGNYYGETYFGDDAKQDVTRMVEKMVQIYKNRIQANDWLSDETKEKAIVKLEKIAVKIGYPDKIEAIYSKFHVTPAEQGGTLYGNLSAMSRISIQENLDKLTKEVDRTEWAMPGNLVNACYDPSRNDITFPAAILQKPFYDLHQSSSANYGGIGAVIAHEISHAFDNNGAQFDEYGNMNNWWQDQDFTEFKKRTQDMIDLFDGVEYGDGKINGKQVVSENVADAGGLSNAIEAAKSEPDADLKELFENWARVWSQKAEKAYMQMLLAVDVHAPGPMRANVQAQNMDEFYEVFDVKETDGMYLDPEKRVNIW